MDVEVTAYDIPGGHARQTLGVFDSVQLSGCELRGPEGETIATYDYPGNEWVAANGTRWGDIVVAPTDPYRQPR